MVEMEELDGQDPYIMIAHGESQTQGCQSFSLRGLRQEQFRFVRSLGLSDTCPSRSTRDQHAGLQGRCWTKL